MAKSVSDTILLAGSPSPQFKFGPASGSITPGMLVELVPSSSTDQVRVHATAGGTAARMFALEDGAQGNTISDAYADGVHCRYATFGSGDEVNALLNDGENAVFGAKLESAGNGKLRVVVTDTSAGTIKIDSVVAIARQAVDMSGSAGADPTGRIRVEIV